MKLRPNAIVLAAMLTLALLVFVACETESEQETLAEPAPPTGQATSVEPATPSAVAAPAEPAARTEPVSVVASIYPLGFFAERVAGDLATVEVLVSPGFETHGFAPTASDLRLLESADLVVMNGLDLNPWMNRALATLGDDPGRIVVEAADESRAIEGAADGHAHREDDAGGHEEDDDHGQEEEDDHAHEEDEASGHDEDDDHGHEEDDDRGHDEEEGHEDDDDHEHEEEDDHANEEDEDDAHPGDDDNGHEEDDGAHDHGPLDPHMWLDPVLAVVQVERIRDALIGIDPGNSEMYQANASALVAELEALDAEFADGLASCRLDHFVTSHAAYGYLAQRYGLEQIPVTGLSPEVEPSPQELAAISDRIAELGLQHVMVEPVLSGGLTQTLARENDIELIAIHAIGSVTQPELDAHDDYFGLMRDNLSNLVLALGCA